MTALLTTLVEYIKQDPAAVVIVFFLFLSVFFLVSILIGRFIGRLEIKASLVRYEKDIRRDAVKRSRSVLLGQLGEQVSPFLPDFPCSPEDARFIGKPVDFIAFSGMSDSEDGESGEIKEVLFIEVKTGKSALSKREKEIKKAVSEGRIRYIEYRIGS